MDEVEQTDAEAAASAEGIVDPDGEALPGLHPTGGRAFRLAKPVVIVVGVLIAAVSVGAAFYAYTALNPGYTTLSFVPATADYYLGIRVGDEDPQVVKGRELAERFPGGAKWAEVFDNAIELFGRPLDPFQEVLTLAEDEIFLAKVRPARDDDERRFARRGLVDELVNIVGLKDAGAAEEALLQILGRDGRTVEEKSADGTTYHHVTLDELDETETLVTLDPLPHQVGIPYSLETYLFGRDRFLISGDTEGDIQEIAKLLADGEGDDRLLPITEDASHQEVASHFPSEPLLRFYQRQELVPQFGLFPWEIFTGFIVDASPPPVRSDLLVAGLFEAVTPVARGQENNTTVGRGVTLEMRDDGAVMTAYSEIRNAPQFRNTFAVEQSNATRLPADLRGTVPTVHIETANLWEKVRGFRETLEEGAKNAEDEETRQVYEEGLDNLEDILVEVGESWGVDFERDILSWMDGNASFTLGAGFDGGAPTYVFGFGTSDPAAAIAGIEKIAIRDEWSAYQNDNRVEEIDEIGESISEFFVANGRDPLDLDELKPLMIEQNLSQYSWASDDDFWREWLDSSVEDTLTDDETEERYAYTVIDGGAGFTLETALLDGRTYRWAFVPGGSLEEGVYIGEKDPDAGMLRPEPVTFDGADVYSLRFPSGGWLDDVSLLAGVTIAITDSMVWVSDSKETIEAVIKGGPSFGDSEGFEAQFSQAPAEIAGLYYIEPYGFFGLYEYVLTLFGEDLDELRQEWEKDQEVQDTIIAVKAYLKTLKDIGGYFALEGRTVVVPTLFRIVELPEAEKNRAEVAIERMLKGAEGPEARGSGSQRGRDARRLADLDAMRLAMEVYADQHNAVYPDVTASQAIGPTAGVFDQLADALVDQQLLSARPSDPTAGRSYVAQLNATSNPTSYIFGADLETDQAACDSDYDGENLIGGGLNLMCAEASPDNCGGSEPDGVDYCVCQGQACN